MDKKQIYSLVGGLLSLAGVAISMVAGSMKGKAVDIAMSEKIAEEVAKQLSNTKES